MRAVLAAAPIVLLVGLLVGARISAARAGWIALALTVVIAVVAFDLGEPGTATRAAASIGIAAEALFITATLAWILVPALAIHELVRRTGALDRLGAWLASVAADGVGRALLVGWFFVLFIEGAAGFGTPLAVAAPMLVALGWTPVAAVATGLIGHAAGVTFGAIGTPVLAQAELVPVSAVSLTRHVALLAVPIACIAALTVARTAPTGAPQCDGSGRSRAMLAAAAFSAPFVGIAWWSGPELPTLAGALLGGALFIALVRDRQPAATNVGSRATLVRAAAPHLVLIALVLVTRLVPPVKSALADFTWQWTLFERFGGSFAPLYHPGTLLIAAFVTGALLQRSGRHDAAAALAAAARRVAPAILALIAMLALSRLMLHAGMIEALADAAIDLFGGAWPAFAPALGAIGSFMTGSATASNVLFSSLQSDAATALALPGAAILAAQTVGAAIGNIVCPHNIVAGAAAVGAIGREGDILRKTLAPAALMIGLTGLLAALLVRWPIAS